MAQIQSSNQEIWLVGILLLSIVSFRREIFYFWWALGEKYPNYSFTELVCLIN